MVKDMSAITSFLESLKSDYNIFISVLALILLIISVYNRIKYLCLEKASTMVAKAEGHDDLSGEEKLALCTVWIDQELPKVFRNSLVKTLIKKLVNFIYDNSFEYMKKYIKRKTGCDVSEVIAAAKEALVTESEDEKSSDEKTEDTEKEESESK